MKTILVMGVAQKKRVKISTYVPLLLSCLGLSACSIGQETHLSSTEHLSSSEIRLAQSPAISLVEQGRQVEEFYPENQPEAKKRKTTIKLGLNRDAAKALGCDMGDRFDRGAALAYNFDNHQTRLSLHLSVDGPSLSNPGNLELNTAMIRFTHKFQKPSKTEEAKCLYPSKVQGLLGSAYNELFVRENYTILDELKDRGLNLK